MPESDPRGPNVRVLEYTVPVLLAALALTQLYLGTQQWLTPWKGGGFGMFSTVDSSGGRSLRVYLVTEDGEEIPTRAPRWFKKRRRQARSFPADFRLRSMVDEMAAAKWIYRESDSPQKKEDGESDASPNAGTKPDTDGSGRARSSASEQLTPDVAGLRSNSPYPKVESIRSGDTTGDYELVKVKEVRLEVWRQIFEFDTNRVVQEKIKDAAAEVPKS